ncbi:MAG: hypothetical protein ACM3U2_02925, partial [Deltaproteobacteria bacterium]
MHPADLPHYIRIDDDGLTTARWQNSSEEVRGALLTAVAMFYLNIGLFNEYVRLSVGMNSALDAFSKEYHGLIRNDRRELDGDSF